MTESELHPKQTLAILLGASSYRRAPKLAQGRAFYNSAQDFYEYLLASEGLGLPRENINWLFDDSRSPSDQLQDIRDFLENRSAHLRNEGTEPQDLVLFYVGHGLFWGSEHTYSFAIRATDEEGEGLTSIRASDLATVIKAHARFLRKFIILDCCFSAAAYREFQSGPLTASRIKLLDELPQRGTSLLCSASAHDPSLAPAKLPRTMFSNGLLKSLSQGHTSLGPRLSLCELGDLIKLQIREDYPDIGLRPEIHSPDQREGDVAFIPVFPNPAYWEARRKAEAEQARAEVEAREMPEAERRTQEAAEERKRKAEAEQARAEAEAREMAAAESRAKEVAEGARRQAEVERTRAEAEAREKAKAERRAQEAADKVWRKEEAEQSGAQAEARVMEVTGAILFIFVVEHMLGNLLIFGGPDPLNRYGHFTQNIVWVERIVLLAAVVLYIITTIRLALREKRAEPDGYSRRDAINFSYASRTIYWSGTLILAFVIFHLLHLVAGITVPGVEFIDVDVYHNVVSGFQVWWVSAWYIFAICVLGVYLRCMFQSVGLKHPRYAPALKQAATWIVVAIVLGYISIPISVLLGLVK